MGAATKSLFLAGISCPLRGKDPRAELRSKDQVVEANFDLGRVRFGIAHPEARSSERAGEIALLIEHDPLASDGRSAQQLDHDPIRFETRVTGEDHGGECVATDRVAQAGRFHPGNDKA